MTAKINLIKIIQENYKLFKINKDEEIDIYIKN